MSLLKYLRKRSSTASVAKERLQIIISHERSQRNTPDFLPKLQKEILEVISKYVHVKPEEVSVNLEKTHGNAIAVLEVNIMMPEEAV